MYGIKLKVWGDYACFTRPEMKVERVSYDVMTPSVARGILEAIYWKPAIFWVVDKIHVLKPICFDNIRRNELGGKISVQNVKTAIKKGNVSIETFIEDDRQQRAEMVLKNVCYVIEAHFEIIGDEDNNPVKHKEMFERRAKKGQCVHRPYFGCREFSVNFELIEGIIPESEIKGVVDLGWMLHDIDFDNDMEARFFRAKMTNGVINIPPFRKQEM
jgi:CRISPR-associated protein Cas5d